MSKGQCLGADKPTGAPQAKPFKQFLRPKGNALHFNFLNASVVKRFFDNARRTPFLTPAFASFTAVCTAPRTATFALALATAWLPVSTWAANDTVLLRVNGQREPSEWHCPTHRAKALANASANPSSTSFSPSDAGTTPTPGTQGAQTLVTDGPGEWTPRAVAPGDANPPGVKQRLQPRLKLGLWGDSHTASGTFVDSLMAALHKPQARAETHPSFIAPSFGLKGIRQPLRRACLSDDWQLSLAYRTPTESREAYAKSLAYIRTDATGGFMWLDFRAPDAQTRVRWADIHIGPTASERPHVLGISVDDGVEAMVQLAPGHSQRLRVQADTAFATLKLRVVSGPLRIDGIAPVYEGHTQAIVDVFSIPGATAKGWRVVDTAYLRREDPLNEGYDVVILQSGTNESLDPDFKVGLYQAQLGASISQLRAAYPRARCILIGPPDAKRSAQTVRLINDSQQRLAAAKGCTHWNWQKAMGGPGASVRWLAQGLMQADLLHLTPQGYAQSARSMASNLPIKVR